MLDRTKHPMAYHARRPFTAAQEEDVKRRGHIGDEERHRRRRITAHAIDNVPPHIPADRDDAMYVTTLPDGEGVRAEITIADVAAHVPLDSPLSHCAHDRAFTVYRPESNDPMFPAALEARMSLEHQQERLALTTFCWLDTHGNPYHTEFARTLCVPDNVDYGMARERMHYDPQFQLMQQTGLRLRQAMKRLAPTAVTELSDQRVAHLSDEQLAQQKLVETFMVTDNHLKSRFMQRAQLPFIFRNFTDDAVGDDGIARAYYSTRWKGHDALARDGMMAEYGHCTSPIRRGADYYNNLMVHYAIDGVEMLQARLSPHTDLPPDQLRWALWDRAAALFALQAGSSSHPGQKRIEQAVALLQECVPTHVDAATWDAIAHDFLICRPPLTRTQLDRYTTQINALVANEQEAQQAPELRRWQRERDRVRKGEESVEKLLNYSASTLHDKPLREFSELVLRAAEMGVMNNALCDETLQRIHATTDERKINKLAFAILIAAPQDERWRPLKKAICARIKHSPDVVDGVIEAGLSRGYINRELYHPPEAVELSRDAASNGEAGKLMSALALYGENPASAVAAPFYSVGHDTRSAESHALYSFLEHWAFGQLRPFDQTKTPNLLYAYLNQPDADRRSIIEQMAESIGARFIIAHDERGGVAHAKAILEGGSLPAPIMVEASAEEGPVDRLAMRRLLRNENFKNAMNFTDLERLQGMMKPAIYLRERLDAYRYDWKESVVPTQRRGGGHAFCYRFTVSAGQEETTYEGFGPNIDRARHDAAMGAIRAFRWTQGLNNPDARSWVGVAGRSQPASLSR